MRSVSQIMLLLVFECTPFQIDSPPGCEVVMFRQLSINMSQVKYLYNFPKS